MRTPNIDPVTIALGRAERFEMDTAQCELDLARLNKQARKLMVMHTFFDAEAREAGIVTSKQPILIDSRSPEVTPSRYYSEPDQPMFLNGNFKGYIGTNFPPLTPSSRNDQRKLCAVFDHATLYVPRKSEEYLLDAAGEVHVPILSITSIRRRLQQGAA